MASKQIDVLGGYATLDGAARVLGLTYQTVLGRVRRGKIPTVRLGGKVLLVKVSDLQAERN